QPRSLRRDQRLCRKKSRSGEAGDRTLPRPVRRADLPGGFAVRRNRRIQLDQFRFRQDCATRHRMSLPPGVAALPSRSRGRLHFEPDLGPRGPRDIFQRDGDHFRVRLTHSIEVAQIGRTIARALGLNEDLTEALALAHDLGHPPFGHAGEEQLDRLMRRFGERFDHNLQALRIVETFESRYARFPGLNLTFEVREGIAKHSRDFERGEFAELDEYLPGLRPPIEAQLIDACDEIAY